MVEEEQEMVGDMVEEEQDVVGNMVEEGEEGVEGADEVRNIDNDDSERVDQESTHVEEEVEYEVENQLEIGMVPKLMLEDIDENREDISL